MEKRIIVMMTLSLVALLFITPCQGSFYFPLLTLSEDTEKGEILKIIPKDDAFHGLHEYLSNEWWYFDAVFENGYSIHVGIKVISFGGRWGFVNQLINIYNQSVIEHQVSLMESFDQFRISEEYPHVSFRDKPIMIFDYDSYNKTGKWNYRISVQIDHIKVNLTFLQKTQGFKYITEYEGWTVAQPKAAVRGTLTIDDNIIPVQGRGYHDHNWNFSISTGLRSTGWYWGKVTSTNYTVTWANILTTPFYTNQIDENIAIINTLNEGFTYIHPENIVFSSNEKEYQNGRFIPTEFHLKIDQDDIHVNVTFNAMSIQRGPPDFLTIHYWRYFVSVNGYIQVEGKRDQIQDMIQIIEYVRFI